jgi:opacity protein-like surface antigen
MKIALVAAMLAALSMPIAVSAQVTQPPVQGQQQTSQAAHEYHRWTKRLAGINLSSQQQQQVQHLLDDFAARHPAGSPRDSEGARVLHEQILGVLTPQQQAQYQQEIQARRAQEQQRRPQQQVQPAPPLR